MSMSLIGSPSPGGDSDDQTSTSIICSLSRDVAIRSVTEISNQRNSPDFDYVFTDDGDRDKCGRFVKMAAGIPDGIIVADSVGRIVSWNAGAENMFGYTAEEAKRLHITDILPQEIFGENASPTQEAEAIDRDGEAVIVELSLSHWTENARPYCGIFIRDISERKAMDDKLRRLAQFDELTGLPNRTLFSSVLNAALDCHGRACVLLVGLDGIKETYEKCGNCVGDELVRSVARRINFHLGSLDDLARLGFDEFGILLTGHADPLQATFMADRLVDVLSTPFEVYDHTIYLGASAGIALGPTHGERPEEILSAAFLALREAKAEGGHGVRLYVKVMRDRVNSKRSFVREIRRAYDRGEFELFYQPQVHLADNVLIGAEALIRWRHPDHGLLPPSAFLGVTTSSRYARQIADWVLEESCSQAAQWRKLGVPNFRIAVNLCRSQLCSDNLVVTVLDILQRTGLPPNGLELELTEDLVLSRDEHDIQPLKMLRQAGVGFALDDYGTGYASMSVLKNYPLTRLKIDRSFIKEMAQVADVTIIRAIIDLAKGFGLEVTAEGIETDDQLARLRWKGCGSGQGYLFGRPVAAADFEEKFVVRHWDDARRNSV